MNLPLSSIPKTRIGTCPHGLPMGACPICNGGGGGGGGSSKKMERPAGEMSWDECFAVGQQMKAQRLAQQQKDVAMQGQIPLPLNALGRLENLAQKIAGIAEKLTNLVQKVQSNPTIFSKAVAFVANLTLSVLNVVNNVVQMAQKMINFVQQRFADISDKLTAVFGELKAAVEKKISDRFKEFKKKAKSFFAIFNLENIEIENVEEANAQALYPSPQPSPARGEGVNLPTFHPFTRSIKNKEEIDGDNS